MKKTTNLLIVMLLLSVITQSQTIKDINAFPWAEPGVYYKDLNDVLEPFVGTYLYNDLATNTSFKIILQKKEGSLFHSFQQDMLIGAYKFIKNGVVKVDTENDLLNNYPDGRSSVINGYMILDGTERGCTDCLPNEKRIYGSIRDPNSSGFVDKLFIRKITVNNQEAIKIYIHHSIEGTRVVGMPTMIIPPGYPAFEEFVLLKQ